MFYIHEYVLICMYCGINYNTHVLFIQSNLSMWSSLLSSQLYLKVSFFCPVIENFICIEPLLRGQLSYKASLYQRWPLNTGLTRITDLPVWSDGYVFSKNMYHVNGYLSVQATKNDTKFS